MVLCARKWRIPLTVGAKFELFAKQIFKESAIRPFEDDFAVFAEENFFHDVSFLHGYD